MSWAGLTTEPPSRVTAASVASVSAAPKYTDQRAGAPAGRKPLASMIPASCSSPRTSSV